MTYTEKLPEDQVFIIAKEGEYWTAEGWPLDICVWAKDLNKLGCRLAGTIEVELYLSKLHNSPIPRRKP